MTISEWCPTCGANIVTVTRGIPSMGTCSNGHKTDRRDVLRRPPADPVAQELAALRAALAQIKADADMAQAALVERAAADCLARSVDVANLPDDHYGDPRTYAAELLEDQHERILALAPDAGVKDLAALRAERDGYYEAYEDAKRLAREIDVAMHGEEGAAKQASLCDLVHPARDLRADRDRLAAELAETRKQVETLRGLPPDYGHDGLRWKIGTAMRRSMDAAHPETDRDAALYHAFLAGLRAALAAAEKDKP